MKRTAVLLCLLFTFGMGLGQEPSNSNDATVVTIDGTKYPFSGAGVQAAIDAACRGNVPGKVVLPSRVISGISTPISVKGSNCTIEGEGKNASVLRAAASFEGGRVLGTDGKLSHLLFTNFAVDGNRGENTKKFDCVDIAGTNIILSGVRVSSCTNQGLLISGPASSIQVNHSEFDFCGSSDHSSANTSGIVVSPGGGSISNVSIGPGNLVHDNNGGVNVFNSPDPAFSVNEVSVFENNVNYNVNDGIAFLGAYADGGQIVKFSAKGNHIFCNGYSGPGWPTQFPRCAAGFLQKGEHRSAGGVGIDVIQNSDERTVYGTISDNVCRDNTFECIALSGNFNSHVNVSGGGRTVTWISGPRFNTKWKSGQTVCIGAEGPQCLHKVASVSTATSLTLESPAGDGNNQILNGPGSMYTTVSGNQAENAGSNTGGPVGPGFFCQFSDHNSYSNNVAQSSYLEGFEAFDCSFTSYDGDKAIGNGRGRVAGRNFGFASYGSMGNSYSRIVANDPKPFPTQTKGLMLDPTTTNPKVVESEIRDSR